MPDSVLHDRFAAEVIQHVDYDFTRLKVTRDMAISLALRASILDTWVEEFIADHPDAVILHLGCGLDSRVWRVSPPPSVLWFDVDYPEVIELRNRLYPQREGYQTIASSVTNPALLHAVPSDRPTMIVAEGLLLYLKEHEVLRLLEDLIAHFDSGEFAFDGYSQLCLTLLRLNPTLRATGASVHWGIDDPAELERAVPGLTLVQELLTYDSAQVDRMSWPSRQIIRLFRVIPALRRLGRLLRYRFR
jgi:O-methyltransferase involved in polyketide biosynthesis